MHPQHEREPGGELATTNGLGEPQLFRQASDELGRSDADESKIFFGPEFTDREYRKLKGQNKLTGMIIGTLMIPRNPDIAPRNEDAESQSPHGTRTFPWNQAKCQERYYFDSRGVVD